MWKYDFIAAVLSEFGHNTGAQYSRDTDLFTRAILIADDMEQYQSQLSEPTIEYRDSSLKLSWKNSENIWLVIDIRHSGTDIELGEYSQNYSRDALYDASSIFLEPIFLEFDTD